MSTNHEATRFPRGAFFPAESSSPTSRDLDNIGIYVSVCPRIPTPILPLYPALAREGAFPSDLLFV